MIDKWFFLIVDLTNYTQKHYSKVVYKQQKIKAFFVSKK